jgi:hypothetical protein
MIDEKNLFVYLLVFKFFCIKRLVFITEVESVYSAVRTESLYKTDTLRSQTINKYWFATATVITGTTLRVLFPILFI